MGLLTDARTRSDENPEGGGLVWRPLGGYPNREVYCASCMAVISEGESNPGLVE